MFKNVASQKLTVLAIDTAANTPKTGDSANLTCYVSKDDGSVTVLGDTSATELDATDAPGLYSFDLTQAETNADKLLFSGKSSASGIRVVPMLIYTVPANFTAASIDSSGRVDVIKINGTSQTARDLGASVLLSSGTGTGQLDFTSGVVKANATQWLGGTIPAVNVTGVPLVDLKYTLGTISPATAGYVGLDWGQVTNKTTTNALTGTTISTAQVAASVTGNVSGNVVGSVGSVASGGIAAASFAAGAIDAAAIATDALGALELAAGAASEIAAAVWDLATSGHTTSGTFGAAAVAAGGAGDPWSTSIPGSYGAGTAGFIVGTNLNATVSSRMATFSLPTNFADLAITASTGRVTAGTVSDKTGYSVSGTTTTFDALQTALNSAHGSGSWATATGFSTLDASGVRTAVGLATANLDTQLADLPTVAEFEARTLVAASYATATALDAVDNFVDTEVAAIKAQTDQLTFVAGKVDANATVSLTPSDITSIADGVTAGLGTVDANVVSTADEAITSASFAAGAVQDGLGSLLEGQSYISANDLRKRYDERSLGQLASDTGTAVAAADLAADENVVACMLDASGMLNAAAFRGGKYTFEDLSGLTGTALAQLRRIVCDLTYGLLVTRRGYTGAEAMKQAPSYAYALEALDRLQAGELIFPTAGAVAAGKPVRAVIDRNKTLISAQNRIFGDRVMQPRDSGQPKELGP